MRWYHGIIGILTVVIGCGLFKSEKKYMPLEIGDDWDYTSTTHMKTTQNDTVIQDTTYTMSFQTKITGEAKTNSGVSVKVSVTTFTTNNDTSYIEERDNDIYSYETLSDTNPDLQLDYPLDNGKTWTSNGFSFEVIGDEDVSVKAGSFSCKKLKMRYGTGGAMISYEWLADGVGMVKSSSADTSEITPGTTMITETETTLDDYTVK